MFTTLIFMNVDWMVRETKHLKELSARPQDARLYGLSSSRRLGRPVAESHRLDVDLAVMIAVNRDEEAIFLDYRAGLKTPAVVLTSWPDDSLTSHRVIASDFAEFARTIGLSVPTEAPDSRCTP